MNGTSHPTRGAWIEIIDMLRARSYTESHPTRGAWIEMVCLGLSSIILLTVAPYPGCVD